MAAEHERQASAVWQMQPRTKMVDLNNFPPFWFVVYGVSSIGMTLLNKSLAINFPFPFLVLAIQNVVTVGFTFVADRLGTLSMNRWQISHLIATIPAATLYVVVLYTSLMGLGMVSIPLLVVCRNLMPLTTAIGEMIFLGEKFPMDQLGSLFVVFLGAVLYTVNDSTFSFSGVGVVLLNMVLTAGLTLVEKQLSSKCGGEQTPTGIRCYRDLLSIPMFLVLAVMHSNFGTHKLHLDMNTFLVLVISCVFSFSIGLGYYTLQKLVAATSIVVANIVYKLLTSFVSFVFFPVRVDPLGWLGMTVGFAGIAWYSWLRQRPKAPVLPVTQSQSLNSAKSQEE